MATTLFFLLNFFKLSKLEYIIWLSKKTPTLNKKEERLCSTVDNISLWLELPLLILILTDLNISLIFNQSKSWKINIVSLRYPLKSFSLLIFRV